MMLARCSSICSKEEGIPGTVDTVVGTEYCRQNFGRLWGPQYSIPMAAFAGRICI